ncbi:DUF2283 domain-containing protein [Candidatus Bipolaricaulota bacterium]|nr:DUF2283 domain-containing protein [Candidatus Bipolaricaulota bacterium]
MRVRYDEEADALYIRLREAEYYESDEIRNKVCVPRIRRRVESIIPIPSRDSG